MTCRRILSRSIRIQQPQYGKTQSDKRSESKGRPGQKHEWYAKNISRKVRSSKKLRGNAGDPMCPPPYGYKKDPDNPRKWIIDEEAAEIVRRIYRLCVEGKGIETTARILQEGGILTPTQYWESKGIRKGGKKSQDTPCKWCKTTITKILTLREYTGTLHELVERIDVYQTQGRGKNRTQRIVIHYNFIGVLDLPEVEEYPENVVLDSRQGVAIGYLVDKAG